jgi:hypothetical protein
MIYYPDEASKMAYHEWLDNLKVGDKVALACDSGWSRRTYKVLEISRMTPTQAVCFNDGRFRLKDGFVIGGGYSQVEPVTERVLQAMEADSLRAWFSSTSRKSLEIDVLRAMRKAYDSATRALKSKN